MQDREAVGKYYSIKLSDEEIEQCDYMQYLGGGYEKWDSRGAFQLHFLTAMGMSKKSKLLDIGCGPGRASKHLIGFLAKTHYCGIDYNPDFIRAAIEMVNKHNLAIKKPVFRVIENFNLNCFGPVFDYSIVFSVLNHCSPDQKRQFFAMISKPMRSGGKVYISHARWFEESYLYDSTIKVSNQFGAKDFDITRFGWTNSNEIFPIIELTTN